MIKVGFYDRTEIETEELNFVVIGARYQGQWLLVRHEDRTTWEIPGGHIESGEGIKQAAKRELFEETGAKEFKLTSVSTYYVQREGEAKSFGQLYYAQVEQLGDLPDLEITERRLVETLPDKLTYPEIQPKLLARVQKQIARQNLSD